MFNLPDLHSIALMLPAVILGLTFHELAHGWTADRLGDHTARHMGRLTINPLAHIDPVGLILLFLAGFGWARPVPVNPYNLKGDIGRGMLLVSLAGPAANMLLAVLSAVVLGAFHDLQLPYFEQIMFYMVHINVVLCFFNLIPVPPLDGSKILAGILPGRQNWLLQLEAYGAILLIILIFTGIIGLIFNIFVHPVVNMLFDLARYISRL
ncbi:MAG: site-2 protease family protein [Pelotomaculum sp.]|uniref:Zn-dependent protease n=1 Tax=Pelotomaculum thermopropionicum (strain DSM 13744 / JCM 10971 / SI) TaxID=370438 RepID=A5D2V5_PELTS|nr:site-2 protease family protein [Pelotomaculum sp.]BAF59418.1 Zn-dependent protease [Pelotomaculum thermopropionicum SI]